MRHFFRGHDYDQPLPAWLFLLICAVLIAVAVVASHAGGDEIKRDASGNVIEREQATATGVVIRDASGNITGRKEIHQNADGSKTVIVRDASGNVIERDTRK